MPDGLWVRSLHAYFIQAGAGHRAVDLEVRHVRDGRSSAWRSVEAIQSEYLLLHLEVMFSKDTAGPTHQTPLPAVPGPEGLPNVGDQLAAYDDTFRPWDEPLAVRPALRHPAAAAGRLAQRRPDADLDRTRRPGSARTGR